MDTPQQKVKIKVKSRRSKGFEAYSSLLFKLLGVLLLTYSVYFYFSTQKGFLDVYFKSLFTKGTESSPKQVVGFTSFTTYTKLLFRFLPIVGLLLLNYYFSKRNKMVSYLLSLVLIGSLTYLHTQLFFHNYFLYAPTHTNYFYTALFLFVPVLVFFMNYMRHRKPLLLFLLSLYFYLFIFELLVVKFDYWYVFSALFLYHILFHVVTRSENVFLNQVTNSLSTYLVLSVFVLRQLYVGHHDSFLPLFFITGFVYFLFFFYESYFLLKNGSLPMYYYTLFSWLHTFYYVSLVLVVNFLFYNSLYYLPLFISLLVHCIVLYYLHVTEGSTKPYFALEIAALVLSCLFVASLWLVYGIALFLGSSSLLLLYYYNYRFNRIYAWVSLLFLQFLLLYFTYLVVAFYIPVFGLVSAPVGAVLEKGFVSCLLLFSVLYGVQKLLRKSKDTLDSKWFDKKNYLQFLRLFALFTLFILIEWIGFSLMVLVTGSTLYFHTLFFIVGSFYMLYLLFHRIYLPQQYKQILYYVFYFYAFSVAILGYFKFPYVSIQYLTIPNFLFVESFLHYFELVLLLLLLIKSYFIIAKKGIGVYAHHFFEVSLSIAAVVLLCKEFDFFLVLRSVGSYTTDELAALTLQLIKNKLLPYSLLILLSSILILVVGIYRNNKFMRFFAIFVTAFTLFKVFYLEYNLLTDDERFGMMVLLGLTFLLLSWIYTKQKSRHSIGHRR